MAKAKKGIKYRVSYDQLKYNGSKDRKVTVVTFESKAEAQKYADKLNDPNYTSAGNARVRKAY